MLGKLARGVPCCCSSSQLAAVHGHQIVSLHHIPITTYNRLHAVRAHAADIPQDSLQASEDAAVLAWSFEESSAAPEHAAVPDAAALTVLTDGEETQRLQQQQRPDKEHSPQQQQLAPLHQQQQQQQQGQPHHRKEQKGTASNNDSSAGGLNGRPQSRTPHTTKQPGRRDDRRSNTHTASSQPSSRRNTGRATDAPDPYTEAQQRVRAVLSAADPSNPAAAAEQLHDTVDDLTIALQLLATAPRPTSLDAYKQYTAALQQLAEAVLQKYKRVVLHLVPACAFNRQADFSMQQQQQHQQQQTQQNPQAQQQQQQLAAGLASLPATRLAAAVFSLGVLRMYDRQLTEGLEAASLQLMRRNAFKPNQLGQIVQGFVYLDHKLSPDWHVGVVNSTRRQLDQLQGPQLASLAVWILAYGQGSAHSSSIQAGIGDVSSSHTIIQPAVQTAQQAAAVHVAPAGAAAAAGGAAALQLDATWIQGYLAAVGRAAGSLKPLQLVQVMQAAAVLVQQQHGSAAAAAGQAWSSCVPVALDPGVVLQHLVKKGPFAGPHRQGSSSSSSSRSTRDFRQQQRGGHAQHFDRRQPYRDANGASSRLGSSSSSSSSSSSMQPDSSSWVVALVAALLQQLPELSMTHLAAALPALLSLTQLPWPQQLLQPVLLQVQLLLPSCTGRDLVVVTQAVSYLAGGEALAAQQEWCNAVLVQMHAQLPQLGPAELAGAVHAVLLLRVKPYKAWVYDLCQRLRVDARAMDALQVLVVLECLAAVGVQLDPEVLHAFVLQIRRWMGTWSSRELGRVVAAVRTMYPKVLPGRTVQQLVGELQRRQQYLELQEVPAGGLFQGRA